MSLDLEPKIFVGGLLQTVDETVLTEYFSHFGGVTHVEIKMDPATGNSRGFGFVTFDSKEAVDLSVSMNGEHDIQGKNVEVKAAMDRSQSTGKGAAKAGGFKGAGKSFAAPALGGLTASWSARPQGAPAAGSYYQAVKGGGAFGAVAASSPYGAGKGAVVAPVRYGTAAAPAAMGKGCKGMAPMSFGPKPTFNQDDAKIFVGGIPKAAATDEAMIEYFGMFGEVANVELKMDPLTGQCRGFGFVTFTDAASAHAVLGEPNHNIQGKWVEVKSAMANGKPAPGQKGMKGGTGAVAAPGTEPCKIFVGGLSKTSTEESIAAAFSQFGTVIQVLLKRDAEGISKNFGFVSFADQASVALVMNNANHNQVDGKWVEVREASLDGKGTSAGGKGKAYKNQAPKGAGGFAAGKFGAVKGTGKIWAPY